MRQFASAAILILILIQCKTTPEKESAGEGSDIRIAREYYEDGTLKAEIEARGNLRHGITKKYSESGILVSTINYENNLRNGKSTVFYEDGSISTVFNYEDGFRHGDSEKYYKNGGIYRITPYSRGTLSGIQRTFWEDGTLQSEMPYKEGEVGSGLKEYTSSGEMKKMDATILVKEINEIALGNRLTLQLSLSDGSRNVKFFKGSLTDGKYWNAQLAPVETVDGQGRIEFYLPRGSFVMETIQIVARKKTRLDNNYILYREYHLAAEHKFIP